MCSLYKTISLFIRGQYFIQSFFAQRYIKRLLSMIVRYTERGRERERDAVNSWFSHGQQLKRTVTTSSVSPSTHGRHPSPAREAWADRCERSERPILTWRRPCCDVTPADWSGAYYLLLFETPPRPLMGTGGVHLSIHMLQARANTDWDENNVANTLVHNSHRPSINWILNKLY